MRRAIKLYLNKHAHDFHGMKPVVILLALLVGFLLVCGCTLNGGTVNTSETPQPTVQQPTAVSQPSPSNAPKYQAGDIIDDTPRNDGPCWLVLSYDPETDMYETAVIFKHDGGSWGYLLDEDTDWDERKFIDTEYPAYIAHVELSDVTIGSSI